MSDLLARIDDAARAPTLLVACDFDGALAPIADTPGAATPLPEARVALRALAAAPATHVAVISGRSLADLAERLGPGTTCRLVGSHGAEFGPEFARTLGAEAVALRGRLVEGLRALAARTPGSIVEEKPAGAAFHFRRVEARVAADAHEEISQTLSALPGVATRRGHAVIDLAVIPANKGAALDRIRRETGASCVFFVGDDVTDEDAFATLSPPDVGVKVGPGGTRAEFRVDDPRDVANLLARLAESRERIGAAALVAPIERHAMLSDLRTVALVSPDARIVWMCAPRIDSTAIFADLVGAGTGGSFDVAPLEAGGAASQAYVEDTLILRTTWPGLTVTDYLDCSAGRPFQRAGRSDLVRVIEGERRARVRFAPRLDFSRRPTALEARPGGLVIPGAADPVALLSAGVEWRIEADGQHQSAVAGIDPRGGPVVLALRLGSGSLEPDSLPEAQRRGQTSRFWSSWAQSLRYPAIGGEGIRRSALVLRGLCYAPTGAISAAATTSLPETIGGVRNWDYRYAWLRDAALSASALVRLGNTGVALRLLDWLMGVADECESPERMRPLYTVAGRHLPPEAEIRELSGYAASRPVRIGNAASQQLQLDVFGPIMELLALVAEAGAPVTPEHWRLTVAIVEAVRARWDEPDCGIWEIRTPPRQHTHSKAMCWFAVDRALLVARRYTGFAPTDWVRLRETIGADVLGRGWSSALGGFSTAYGSDEPDAAALLLGLCGLLSPSDPRFAQTVRVVEERLRFGPTVRRYLFDDGLPGREGGFHICTGWLIESLALLGRRDEARALFDQFAALAGPTLLLPEQYEPETGRGLGNFPQAYSHLALINAAVRLSEGAAGG